MTTKINQKTKNGFTLVEALVAISILMIAVTGPLMITQKGLVSAIGSKDQMVAAFLAQDAIEFVKNARDNAGVLAESGGSAGAEWLPTILSCTAAGCNFDTLTGAPGSFSICMKRDAAGVFQGYGIVGDSKCNGNTSKYTRKILITKTSSIVSPGLDEAYVDVTVAWGNGLDQQVRIGSYVYNYWGNL